MKIIDLYLIARKFISPRILMPVVSCIQKGFNLIKYRDANFPRSISIEVSAHCNRRCSYCPQSVDPTPRQFIEWSTFEQAISRIKELNWKWGIEFHFYNEPLLVKDLEKYVAYAKKNCPNAALRLLTNGDLLTEERFLSLKAAGIVYICISRHEPIKPEWDERVKFLTEKYSEFIWMSDMSSHKLSNRGGLVKTGDRGFDLSNGCSSPSTALHITLEGNYLYCCCDYKKEYATGNIFDSGILEAWKSPYFSEARKSVRKAKPLLEICKACYAN